MKSKFLSVLAFAACLLTGFTSCSDNNDDYSTPSNDSKTQTDMADYTVILWASAGDNENSTVSDIAEMLLAREEGKITGNINLVGCLDPSNQYERALAAKNLGGTLELELGTKQNTGADTLSTLKEVAGIDKSLELDELSKTQEIDFVSYYAKAMPAMKSLKANSGYDIYSETSLAQYIAKAAKEHPAKKYVLLLYGHGFGYNPSIDGNATTASRACVTSTSDDSMLTLDNVTNAIQNSGVKIQTVVYNCCQMAALENFAGMKKVTDYVVASAEPILGGYVATFLAELSKAGATDDGMKNTCKKTIDFYKDNVSDKCVSNYYTSHGFYDLSMTDQLLSTVKKAATWFESAAKSNPQFMKDVVYNSAYCFPVSLDQIDVSLKKLHTIKGEAYKHFSTGTLDIKSVDDLKSLTKKVLILQQAGNAYGTCFASIMDVALSDKLAAEANGLNMDELRSIYTEYLSTLKQMAYIRCNGTEADDAAYRYASPSINLFSMNEKGFFAPESVNVTNVKDMEQFAQHLNEFITKGDTEGAFNELFKVVGGSSLANGESLASVKAKYTNTDFDKATGWSKVLENVNVNPVIAVSATRYDIVNK